MIPPELLTQYRNALRSVSVLVQRQLNTKFAQITWGDPARATTQLTALIQATVGNYGEVTAVVAGDFYDEARSANSVPGRFRAVLAALPVAEQIAASTRWATGPLWSASPNQEQARINVTGVAQRLVQQPGRATIVGSTARDTRAGRFARTGGDCNFCLMLISRGAVFSDRSAHFQAHDHCDCVGVPVWSDDDIPAEVGPLSEAWQAATRGKSGSEARNAFAEYLAQQKA